MNAGAAVAAINRLRIELSLQSKRKTKNTCASLKV